MGTKRESGALGERDSLYIGLEQCAKGMEIYSDKKSAAYVMWGLS